MHAPTLRFALPAIVILALVTLAIVALALLTHHAYIPGAVWTNPGP